MVPSIARSGARFRILVQVLGALVLWVALGELAGKFLHRFPASGVAIEPYLEMVPVGEGGPSARWMAVPELGGLMDRKFERMVALGRTIRREADAAGLPPERRVLSAYTSALDVIAGARCPTRNDYLIHALGAERLGRYVAQFLTAPPRYVTTIRVDHALWEYWLRRADWDFYRQLVAHYDPVDRTFYNILWRRRQEPRRPVPARVECRIVPAERHRVELHITLPADQPELQDEPWLIDVEIDYAAHRTGDWIGRGVLRNYLIAVDKPVAIAWGLPTSGTQARFPVELAPGESTTVTLIMYPEPVSAVRVTRATARPLMPARLWRDDIPLPRLFAADWSEGGWHNGIRVEGSAAAFRVTDPADLRGLAPGSRLDFPHSGRRSITRMDDRTIWVDGSPLDPQRDGFPHPIGIVGREMGTP